MSTFETLPQGGCRVVAVVVGGAWERALDNALHSGALPAIKAGGGCTRSPVQRQP